MEVFMPNLEASKEELELITILLQKEEVSARIELHHARTYEFKDLLKERDKLIIGLIERIKKILPG
jgi:hypothetical protein